MKLVPLLSKITVWISSKETFTVIYRRGRHTAILIEHNKTYTSKGTPGNTEISIHNLIKSHANYFKKGRRVRLTAGWYNADDTAHIIHQVVDDKISTVTPPTESTADSVVHL